VTEQRLESIPPDQRETARAALTAAFGSSAITRVDAVRGGASGASVYRAEVDDRTYLVRIEGPRHPLRNPHQYVCMRTAADAGIAPPIHFVDAEAGVAVMDYVVSRPLSEYPGGPRGLVEAVGALLERLQQTPPFPDLRDYSLVLERLLGLLRSRIFAPGVLDPHAAAFERLRAAYPWDASAGVSSHNDPNPHNLLFDGRRLWLIDWETAYRNDPWVDVAIVAEHLASSSEMEGVLLEAWLGIRPDVVSLARLRVMRVLTRLYYAGLLLGIAAARQGTAPIADLSSRSEDEFREAVAAGTIASATPETLIEIGKMKLAGFLGGLADPAVNAAVQVLEAG
jgi:aminoglycoside phosphotransferase (APT) family kinase protein